MDEMQISKHARLIMSQIAGNDNFNCIMIASVSFVLYQDINLVFASLKRGELSKKQATLLNATGEVMG